MSAPTDHSLPLRGPHLRLSLFLGGASALATLALFPYLVALMPQRFAMLPLPLSAAALLQAAQVGVLCWLLGWLGLALGARHGLDAPRLRAWVYHRPLGLATPPARWWQAASLGILAALVVIGLGMLAPHMKGIAPPTPATGWAWRGALASFYGAIAEEVQTRLLLVSLLVWLLAQLHRGDARRWMFPVAIVTAALLFGAGHLPAAFAAGLAATPADIAHIVLLNAVVGIVFGWLFWQRGLEHAMLAHFCADLVLHVAWPLLRFA
jgi:hypothetical protein